jgi:hypothetical protein
MFLFDTYALISEVRRRLIQIPAIALAAFARYSGLVVAAFLPGMPGSRGVH